MSDTATISLRGVCKSYGPVHALQDVSLDVSRGDVLGLIGENGAGKSTLIGVLTGTVRPDAGSLDVNGTHVELGDSRTLRELGISVVVQEQSLVDALRVYENIYLGREGEIGGWGPGRRRRMRDAAQSLLDTLGIEGLRADAVVAELTYPQRQLVEIARAFSRITDATEAPVILLDEPTSALTETEVEILFALIEGWRDRVSFIFVSHILQDVLRISTRLLVLRDGRSIETLSADGVTAEQLHELMVGSERSADYYREGEQTGVLSTKPLIELRDASSAGEFESVDLVVRPGEVVGLAGVIGSGKASVAAAVAGAESLSAGSIHVDGTAHEHWSVPAAVAAGVLYVPPERAQDSLFRSASIRNNISIGFLDLLRHPWTRLLRLRTERERTTQLARALQVKAPSLSTPIGELSGGNQQKAIFARWQGRECKVLVLSDPTRGIDVGTREEIYGLVRSMAASGVGVLLCAESPRRSDRNVRPNRGHEGRSHQRRAGGPCRAQARRSRRDQAHDVRNAVTQTLSKQSPASDAAAPSGARGLLSRLDQHRNIVVPTVAVLVLIIYFQWRTESFITATSAQNILNQMAFLTVLALAGTFCHSDRWYRSFGGGDGHSRRNSDRHVDRQVRRPVGDSHGDRRRGGGRTGQRIDHDNAQGSVVPGDAGNDVRTRRHFQHRLQRRSCFL